MKHRGMTLMEVLVACVIAAVLGVGVMLFLKRDMHLQSRLRVHEWAAVVLASASALAQSNVFDVSSHHPTVSGYLQEGRTTWRYWLRCLSHSDLGDAIQVQVCEQASSLCWSRQVIRWRYASS